MKISSSRDIDAAPEAVFAALADFDRHEARARANGVAVARLDDPAAPGRGAWRILADIRGAHRPIEARVVACEAPARLALRAEGDGLSALILSDVRARERGGATLDVSIALSAATLKARLLLHSLKLARGPLTLRLDRRLDDLARQIAGAS